MQSPLRIAMWSGPRNISTAMMRSWGNRRDTFVCDEPLYAHYLVQRPDVDHPGRDEVIAHHETDLTTVTAWLRGPVPDGKRIFYQKHMAHHLLPGMPREWLDQLTHCFLIREPAEMLASLLKKYPRAGLADTGLPQQVELFEAIRRNSGRTPPVLDARDVLASPRRLLELLCTALEVDFDEAMLNWPAGPRATDGIWAKYWYDAVYHTSRFAPQPTTRAAAGPEHADLLAECRTYYQRLHAARLAAA